MRELLQEIRRLNVSNVLITCTAVRGYGGSQNIALDLVKVLKREGINVDILTDSSGPPMLDNFTRIGVEVHSLEDLHWEGRLLKNYDLLIGFHWPVYGSLLYLSNINFKYIVLVSLSHIVPIETICIGRETADLIVFGTEQNGRSQLDADEYKTLFDFLPNSLPHEWFLPLAEFPQKKRVAIITNHAPPELLAATEMLRGAGISVELIGGPENQIFVDADLIDSYSAVVSIGLTVQKAMARGRPVYLYDHFGGVGWLSPSEAILLEANNFSCRFAGRRFPPERITLEILNGLIKLASIAENYRAIAERRYRLEAHITRLFKRITAKDEIRLQKPSRQSSAIMSEIYKTAHPSTHVRSSEFVDSYYEFTKSVKYEYVECEKVLYKDIVVQEKINSYPRSAFFAIQGNAVPISGVKFDQIIAQRDDSERFAAVMDQPSPWLAERFDDGIRYSNAFFSMEIPIERYTQKIRIYASCGSEVYNLFVIELSI